MKIHKSILPIVVGTAVLASPPLSAATSDVVGYTTFTAEQGGNYLVGTPFLKAKSFQGQVASASGTTISVGADLPEITAASFVHVLSGAEEGRVSTILSADTTTDEIVVEDALSLATDDIIAVRPHFTLGDLGSLPDFSSVTIFQQDGTELAASYLFGSWDQPADTIIFPGEGVLLNLSEGASIIFTGAVASEPVTVRLAPGVVNLINGVRPVGSDSSLAHSGQSLFVGLPDFTSISTYEAGSIDNPIQYNKLFGSWDGDLDMVDINGSKAQLVNPPSEVFVTLPGISL
jgi:hypothetical protein